MIRPGGQLDQGYAIADDLMEPLGLQGIERPQWMPIPYATGDLHATVDRADGARRRPATAARSRSCSRAATRRSPSACDAPAFTLKGGDGVLRAGDDAPPAVRGAIGTLAPAPVWSSARVEAGDGRILVSRRRGGQSAGQHDLWLAERLATPRAG